MKILKLKDDYIKLGQALKAAGSAQSGAEAKEAVQRGLVKVNGETDLRRGRKLRNQDVVEYNGDMIKIES